MHFYSISNIQHYLLLYVLIACEGSYLRVCAYTDNTAMTIDLMVIRY